MSVREGEWTGLDEAFAELEHECADIARGLSVRAFNSILSKTPQYLGRMAASWTYSIGAPEYVDRSSLVRPPSVKGPSGFIDYGEFTGLWRGHPFAIAIAGSANAGKDRGLKLGDVVYLSNGVDHGEGEYSQGVEDGTVKLRAENLPGAPVSRTIDYIGVTFADISPVRAKSLKALRIGQPDASSNP